jgi:hypothetical protein
MVSTRSCWYEPPTEEQKRRRDPKAKGRTNMIDLVLKAGGEEPTGLELVRISSRSRYFTCALLYFYKLLSFLASLSQLGYSGCYAPPPRHSRPSQHRPGPSRGEAGRRGRG